MPRPARWLVLVPALSTGLAACVFTSVRVREIPHRTPTPQNITTPVKAHLADGGVVLYRGGVRVTPDSLVGRGWRFGLERRDSVASAAVALRDVVALEAFSTDVSEGATFLGTVFGIALGAAGTAALLVAIFGSCPTVYADSGAGLALQGESFSSSIAPLFEARDVDRLAVRTDAEGRFSIEIRNEALETHYINHLQLLEIRHGAGETVVPDRFGRPLVVAGLTAPRTARDRAGADRARDLARADGRIFRTQPSVVRTAAAGGALEDVIELVVPRPAGDSAAIVLRLRNSLLNTVLLYDLMLAGRGAGAVDWLQGDMARIGEAAELGSFMAAHMGLRFSVYDSGSWRPAGRIGDAGPIAWKDIGAVLPVPAGDSLRIRLTFVADNWRIDRVAIAAAFRRAEPRSLPVADIRDGTGRLRADAMAAAAAADARYLVTHPSDRFTVSFEAGRLDGGEARTFLLVSQGYYTEWIRTPWLSAERVTFPSLATDSLARMAVQRWVVRQEDFERRFESTRIPVR